MDSENLQLLLDVSTMYYNVNMTQEQIAKKFGLSRPKVSRLLTEARKKGIVKIFISNVLDDMSCLENRFASLFPLMGIRVISVPVDDKQLALQLTAREAAKFFAGYLQNGDTIGVGWGNTLNEVARYFPSASLTESNIVQLCGNLDNGDMLNFAHDILTNFAAKLGIKNIHSLPCPIIVDNQIILDTLFHDEKIKSHMEFASKCNKMIVNINAPDNHHCLYRCGYINDGDIAELDKSHATGSICCHFYDINGDLCCPELDSRTISVSMDSIRKANCVLSCVVGEEKSMALYSTLKAGLIDVLAVDSITATKVLAIYDAEK